MFEVIVGQFKFSLESFSLAGLDRVLDCTSAGEAIGEQEHEPEAVSGLEEVSPSGDDFSLIVSKGGCLGLGRGDRSHVLSTSALT